MTKIAIFASGKGSNADQLMTYFKESPLLSIELLVTNNSLAKVVDVAHKHQVNVKVVDSSLLSAKAFIDDLKMRNVEVIVLAGFLKKIPELLIEAFENKIINIHPSLLPKYGGKGMYGANVHRSVIENGETESGISIHQVNSEYDKGELLAQYKCPVYKTDTVELLSKRIQELEHKYLPIVLEEFIKQSTQK